MPISTRRQSGSMPKPKATAQDKGKQPIRPTATVADDDPMEGDLTELSSSGDEDEGMDGEEEIESEFPEEENSDKDERDSDYDGRNSMLFPMPKRRKLEKVKASKNTIPPKEASLSKPKNKRPSRRVQGRLQNMLSLPLDVLFIIFTKMQPADLLSLARTSKCLREILMSRKSLSVWKSVRRSAGITEVPEPPEDMSEPAWAELLFGPAVCSGCSAKNIHRVDFALRRRLCTVCRKTKLVLSTKFTSQCPGVKDSIINLLPYTRVGGWAHGHASNSRFYWKPDVYEMNQKLNALEEGVATGQPGAKQALKAFRAERVVLVDSIMQECDALDSWATRELQAQEANDRLLRERRDEELKARILSLGFVMDDINHIGWYNVPGANLAKEFTETTWKRLKPKVESTLNAARVARLAAERWQRECAAKRKCEQAYTMLLKEILPVQRLYLPTLSQVTELSCFKDLMDPDRDVSEAQWDHAITELPKALGEWMVEHRDHLIAMLPSAPAIELQPMPVMRLSDPSTNDHFRRSGMAKFAGPLELATSVFRSNKGVILIGRDACNTWKDPAIKLQYCARGAQAAQSLVQLQHIDGIEMTPATLDSMDRRFVCENCLPSEAECHSWRSCIEHWTTKTDTAHSGEPQWRRMRHDEAEEFAAHEWDPAHDLSDWPESWLCNHCYGHLSPPSAMHMIPRLHNGDRESAVSHVRTRHGIQNPVDDVDIFAFPMIGQGAYYPPCLPLSLVAGLEHPNWEIEVSRRLAARSWGYD